VAIFLSPFQWTSSGHIKSLSSAKIFRQSPRTDLLTRRSARAAARNNPMHARGPFFHFLQHTPSPCDSGPPQSREHPDALHPPGSRFHPFQPSGSSATAGAGAHPRPADHPTAAQPCAQDFAFHPPAVAATPTSPAEAPPPQPREHTHSPPRPPHSLSGGRRRLTDDGHGASRGTLRTDAVDRSGWLALPSEEHSQPVAVAGTAESTESPAS
jgi:hypothetical protein